MEGPGDFQLFYIVAGDLIQRYKAAAAWGVAVVVPVFLLFGFIHRDQRQGFSAESNGRVWLEHLHEGANHANRQYRAEQVGQLRQRRLAFRFTQRWPAKQGQ
ncbi:hypothetical protein D3C78_1063960 [compost metagenome]